MYRYEMIAKNEEDPTARQLGMLSADAALIKLQWDPPSHLHRAFCDPAVDGELAIHFIRESPTGYIKWQQRIDGYCNLYGDEIFIMHGLPPKALVATVIHEVRHCFQIHDPKFRECNDKIREQDARLFEREFWGSHSNSGNASTLTRTLNEILQKDLGRVWKKACASAHARLSKPTNTESDQLRAQFAPVLKARSLAVQQFVDPNNSRRLFPDNIEFSAPCAGLKVSY